MYITEAEIHSRFVTEIRIFEILRASDTIVTKLVISKNMHGEFIFISAKVSHGSILPKSFYEKVLCGCPICRPTWETSYPGVTFWGMGFDERVNRFYENEWRFIGATDFSIDTNIVVPLEVVIAAVEKRRPLSITQTWPA